MITVCIVMYLAGQPIQVECPNGLSIEDCNLIVKNEAATLPPGTTRTCEIDPAAPSLRIQASPT